MWEYRKNVKKNNILIYRIYLRYLVKDLRFQVYFMVVEIFECSTISEWVPLLRSSFVTRSSLEEGEFWCL